MSNEIETIEIKGELVSAWFRGKIDSIRENLERLNKYKTLHQAVRNELVVAEAACERASAILLHAEGKKELAEDNPHNGFGCFTGESIVTTPNPAIPIYIKHVVPGMKVLGWDTEKKCFTTPTVKRVILSLTTTLYTFGFWNDRGHSAPSCCSPKQRFFTKDGFVEAQNIAKDTALLDFRQSTVPSVVVVGTIKKEENVEQVVYGLELEEGPRTFFVDGVLAHNIKI